jgi:hypothetical protein
MNKYTYAGFYQHSDAYLTKTIASKYPVHTIDDLEKLAALPGSSCAKFGFNKGTILNGEEGRFIPGDGGYDVSFLY